MIRFPGRKFYPPWLTIFALLATASPAQSRIWSHDPVSLAQDYAIITDNRSKGDLAMIIWLAPPIISDTPANQAARELLDKYVTIGVVHAYVTQEGTTSFDQITVPEVRDKARALLKLLDPGAIPPAMVGALATLQSIFSRTFGAFGNGIQWFTFDGETVHACRPGGMSVLFAGETYTYDTPVPGCS